MNKRVATFIFATLVTASAFAEVNVGVSIGVRQPGVYGRIEIGEFPPPPVINAQPVIIVPRAVTFQEAPVYLYAPPNHQKNWRKHCKRYGACGRPVYFVEEQWVADRYQERHSHRGREDGPGNRGHKEKRNHGRSGD